MGFLSVVVTGMDLMKKSEEALSPEGENSGNERARHRRMEKVE